MGDHEKEWIADKSLIGATNFSGRGESQKQIWSKQV